MTCAETKVLFLYKESYNSTYRLLWKLSLKQVWITQQLQQYSCAEMIKNSYATSLIRRGILGWKWNLCRKSWFWLISQLEKVFKLSVCFTLTFLNIQRRKERKKEKRSKSSFKSLFILRWVKFYYMINWCSNSFVQNFLLLPESPYNSPSISIGYYLS